MPSGERQIVDADRVRSAIQDLPDEDTFNGLAEIFGSLSNQTRLKIVNALSRAELCVGDLAAVLNMTESAVSHQLRLLRTMRVVRHRRDGKLIYYALDDQHIEQLFGAALEHLHE